ncbi:MAG TPA: HlyD family secretion protein [Spirochaetia bacterium]|nr:HlyD family secretion protein [Spirochaetia bacterium]
MSDQQETPKKKRTGRIVLVVVILALVTGGIVAYVRIALSGFQSTDDASVKGNQVVISAVILDRITRLAAGEGDRVSQGQTLVTLDDATLKAQEEQSRVNEQFAAQNITLATIKMDQARTDLERGTVQFQSKIIPQEQYDHLKIALQSAQAQLDIATTQEKLAAAQLRSVETNLANTIISSTIDGVVAKKWAMPGDVVQPAQPIYTLFDLNDLWIEANFKETQIRYLAVGNPVTITIDAFPGTTFTGKVETIGAAAAAQFALIPPSNATGNFTKVTQRVPVRISINHTNTPTGDPTARLVPGMSATVRVATSK